MKNTKNKSILSLLLCSVLLLNSACKKNQVEPNFNELNAQESRIFGKWLLKKTDTYEVSGADSSGQYQCTLITSDSCTSNCPVEFENQHSGNLYAQNFIGKGSVGGCDEKAIFIWNAKQQNKLDVNSGTVYDIVYLSADSIAFSNVYLKDILKLKSVFYYKRD